MIKKLIYGFVVIAGLASCNDDYTDWANPQSNAANEAVAKFTLTATPAVSDIKFADIEEDSVLLFTTNLQQGQAASLNLTLTGDDGEKSASITASEGGRVAVADLTSAVASIYGKAPTKRALNITVSGDITISTADGDITADKSAAPFSVNMTLDAPFIDSAYYLVGDMLSWDATGMAKFDHSDSDVYDDPLFTVTFTTTADGQYWQIIPQTNVDGDFWAKGKTGVVGVAVDGDTSMSGSLTTDNPKAGRIEKAGTYVMTINMMDYTYTIQSISRFYMVGGLPGWSAEGAITALFYPTSSTVMSYTTKWPGAWDLKIWSESTIGNWDVAYGTAVDGDGSASGTLINSGAQSFQAPSQNEFYTLTINMGTMAYTWTKLDNQNPTSYTTVGLIGDFNGWGGDVTMTEVTPHNWYVETEISTSGGLKFRANGGWDVNWGASLSVTAADYYATAVGNGENIYVPAGKYRIYLNDITGQCAFVAVE